MILVYTKVFVVIAMIVAISYNVFIASIQHRQRKILPLWYAFAAILPAFAGLLIGSLTILYVLLMLLVAFGPGKRVGVCSRYILLLPMMPALQTEIYAGSLYIVPISTFLAINIGAMIGLAVTPSRSGRKYSSLDLAAVTLVVMLSYIYGRDLSATAVLRVIIQQMMFVLPPYLIMSRSLRHIDDSTKVITCMSFSGFVGSVVAIFGAVRHWDLYETMFIASGVMRDLNSSYVSIRGGFLRMGGPIADYSSFGIFLAVVLVALPQIRQIFHRLAFWVVYSVVLVGLVSTQSRGAWIGYIAGVTATLIYRRAYVKAFGLTAVVLLVFSIARLVLGVNSRLGGIVGLSGDAQGTGEYRQRLFNLGLNQIRNHPLEGQSPEALIVNLPELIQGQHIVDFVNSHLFVAMSAGIPLFLAWLFIWIAPTIRTFIKVSPVRNQRSQGIHFAPGVILIVTFVCLTFTSLNDRNLLWALAALGMMSAQSTRRFWADDSDPLKAPKRLRKSLIEYSSSNPPLATP